MYASPANGRVFAAPPQHTIANADGDRFEPSGGAPLVRIGQGDYQRDFHGAPAERKLAPPTDAPEGTRRDAPSGRLGWGFFLFALGLAVGAAACYGAFALRFWLDRPAS